MCIFTCIRKVHIVFFIRVYYGGHMSNLRKYRESLNISQTTLAKAVGCTQGV
ncbi:helix-turn-helix transcriptional regulator, partial [Escherichia coli]|nr:helix-turn-helix transcriptional regulator [Escherichia coli]